MTIARRRQLWLDLTVSRVVCAVRFCAVKTTTAIVDTHKY